jgi:hypothetical protein
MKNLRIVTQGLARRDREWSLNDGQIPIPNVVRVALGTGYHRVEGNRRASRNGPVSVPTRNPKSRFATFASLLFMTPVCRECCCARRDDPPPAREEPVPAPAPADPVPAAAAAAEEAAAAGMAPVKPKKREESRAAPEPEPGGCASRLTSRRDKRLGDCRRLSRRAAGAEARRASPHQWGSIG